jgi:hypothetical protein
MREADPSTVGDENASFLGLDQRRGWVGSRP